MSLLDDNLERESDIYVYRDIINKAKNWLAQHRCYAVDMEINGHGHGFGFDFYSEIYKVKESIRVLRDTDPRPTEMYEILREYAVVKEINTEYIRRDSNTEYICYDSNTDYSCKDLFPIITFNPEIFIEYKIVNYIHSTFSYVKLIIEDGQIWVEPIHKTLPILLFNVHEPPEICECQLKFRLPQGHYNYIILSDCDDYIMNYDFGNMMIMREYSELIK